MPLLAPILPSFECTSRSKETLSIAQLGPNFLILQDKVAVPPGTGTIILQVDESERRWSVRLPEGIDIAKQRAPIQNLGQAPLSVDFDAFFHAAGSSTPRPNHEQSH